MSVMIRMSRGGTKKKPYYNIIVTNKRDKRDGEYLKWLGFYDPKLKQEEKRWNVNMDEMKAWIAKGAQLSETVGHLYKAAAKSK